MKKLINFIWIFIVGIVFIGCAQNQVDIKPKITDSHIIIENQSLDDWLQLEKVNYFKRKDELLVVEVKFKNTSIFNKKVAYKIDWIDENGFTENRFYQDG